MVKYRYDEVLEAHMNDGDRDVGIAAILMIIGAAFVFGCYPVREVFPVEIIKAMVWLGVGLKLSGLAYLLVRFAWSLLLLLRLSFSSRAL